VATQNSPVFSCAIAFERWIEPRGSARCAAVQRGEVVSLASATEVEDFVPAVLLAYFRETRGNLGDRSVPVNLFEGPVTASAERLCQPVGAVLIEIEPMGLLARIAL